MCARIPYGDMVRLLVGSVATRYAKTYGRCVQPLKGVLHISGGVYYTLCLGASRKGPRGTLVREEPLNLLD